MSGRRLPVLWSLTLLLCLAACSANHIAMFPDSPPIAGSEAPLAVKIEAKSRVALRLNRTGGLQRIYETGWIDPADGLAVTSLPPGHYRLTGVWLGNEFSWLESWHHPMVLFDVEAGRLNYPGTLFVRAEYTPRARGRATLMRIRVDQREEPGAREQIERRFASLIRSHPFSYTGRPMEGPDR